MGAEHHSPTGCEYSGACDSSCRSAGPDTIAGRDLSNDDYDHDDYDTGRSASSHARGGGSCATNVVRGTYRFRR